MRIKTLIALMAVLALFATACGGDDDTATTEAAETTAAGTETTEAPAEAGGTLVAASIESFDGWVLDSAAAYVTYQTHLAVMEPLLRFGADGQSLEPGLAQDWEYDPDALTMTFTLQDGAAFSNGEPVTAEDVAFSLEVWKSGPNFGESWTAITGVRGEGNQVIMDLEFPDNTVLPLMASSVSGVMPKDFAGMTEDEFYTNPIGAGAYTVEEWSIGGRIVLKANPNFYDP